jgi:hypothetical protein
MWQALEKSYSLSVIRENTLLEFYTGQAEGS